MKAEDFEQPSAPSETVTGFVVLLDALAVRVAASKAGKMGRLS